MAHQRVDRATDRVIAPNAYEMDSRDHENSSESGLSNIATSHEERRCEEEPDARSDDHAPTLISQAFVVHVLRTAHFLARAIRGLSIEDQKSGGKENSDLLYCGVAV